MVTKNSGRPRRKRSFSVKTQAFTLIEERLEDMGWTFKNTSEIYDHLVEETHLSLDTIRNFFNPQWKRYPEKKTVETIAALLNIKPCDLVQDWIVPEEENSDDTLNQEVILARSLFEKMLDKQRYLTSNLLINANLERSNVYVPLELVERKEISRHKEVKVERGADLYRPQHYENTRAIQMSQFLEEVIGKGNSPKSQGKRIAIIGEPGSGKTTRLQEVADWLLRENDGNLVIWISLADLQGETLEEFLLDVWLKIALERTTTDALSHEALVRKFKEGNVWLLLDGLDEMGIDGSPLSWLDSQLQGWISWAKVILTCRLNLWDGGRQPLYNFDVYQNCDFSDVQRDEFIRKFFNDTELSAGLIEKLNKPGKERIRNLARNPLRLTLICHSWCKRQGSLPETKAGLYKECVDAYYDWKEKPKVTGEQRKQLNKALGELAKQALEDRNYRFRITYDRASNILGDADEGLFKLALELGWLNQVGVASENPGEKIYAFLHPSFQEYFAAAVIEDGAYFMPDDPDNLEGYRIFDNNLKEVASYWLERDDIDQKSKEAVIDGLLNFNSGNVGLHAYSDNLVYTLYEDRAYSIALELVSYQPKIYLKPSILEQITEIIYNHVFNDDKYSQFAVKTTWIYKDCLAKLSVNLKLNILHYLLNDLRYDDNGVKYEYINKLTITGSISNQDRQILNKCLDLVIKHQPYLQLVFIARTLDNIDDKLKVQSLLRNIIYSSKDKVQDEEYYIYLCCWSLELLEKIKYINFNKLNILKPQEFIDIINETKNEGIFYNFLKALEGNINQDSDADLNKLFNWSFNLLMSAEETLETRQFDLDILHWLEVKKVCVNLCRQILEISDVLVNVFLEKVVSELLSVRACFDVRNLLTYLLEYNKVDEVKSKQIFFYCLDCLDRDTQLGLRQHPFTDVCLGAIDTILSQIYKIENERLTCVSFKLNAEEKIKAISIISNIFQNTQNTQNTSNPRFYLRLAEIWKIIEPDNPQILDTVNYFNNVLNEIIKQQEEESSKHPHITKDWTERVNQIIQERNQNIYSKVLEEQKQEEEFNSFKKSVMIQFQPSTITDISLLTDYLQHEDISQKPVMTSNTISKFGMIPNGVKNKGELALHNLTKTDDPELIKEIVYQLKPFFMSGLGLDSSEEERKKLCFQALWYCAMNLNYQEFVESWLRNKDAWLTPVHPEIDDRIPSGIDERAKSLEKSLGYSFEDLVLKTDNVYSIVISLRSLEDETDKSCISQEFCNQVYFKLFPDEMAEKVQNFSDFKRLVPEIKQRLGTQRIAIIIADTRPEEHLVKFVEKLEDCIYFKWIEGGQTKYSIPEQKNLVSILRNWLDEIGQQP